MEYEWDPEKDRINQRLHGVSFAEASTVFLDPLAATVPDERFAVTLSNAIGANIVTASAIGVILSEEPI